jgi:hypothetical protein
MLALHNLFEIKIETKSLEQKIKEADKIKEARKKFFSSYGKKVDEVAGDRPRTTKEEEMKREYKKLEK